MVKFDGDNVTITKEYYKRLLSAQLRLDFLEAAGVDNWEGCENAFSNEDFGFEKSYSQLLEDIENL